jgi:hypothetical protein
LGRFRAAGEEDGDHRNLFAPRPRDEGAHLGFLPGAEALHADEHGSGARGLDPFLQPFLPWETGAELPFVQPDAQALTFEQRADLLYDGLVAAVVAQEDVKSVRHALASAESFSGWISLAHAWGGGLATFLHVRGQTSVSRPVGAPGGTGRPSEPRAVPWAE